jgi:hypothetical protein
VRNERAFDSSIRVRTMEEPRKPPDVPVHAFPARKVAAGLFLLGVVLMWGGGIAVSRVVAVSGTLCLLGAFALAVWFDF